MTKKELTQEILNVITCSNFNASDYFEDFGEKLHKTVSNWVKKNDVNDIEYIIDEEGVNDVYGVDELKSYATKPIKFVKGCCEISRMAFDLMGNNYKGPGWNGYERNDVRWNSEYLFLGSDGTFYTLIKKIV